MRLLSQKIFMGIVCLYVLACEPFSKETAFPKNIVIVQKDTVVVKVDSVKIISIQDSIKKTVEGVQIFEFYDITSPDISINFPSHSIVSIPVNIVGKDVGVANSFCEYWLYTKDGKLVFYLNVACSIDVVNKVLVFSTDGYFHGWHNWRLDVVGIYKLNMYLVF